MSIMDFAKYEEICKKVASDLKAELLFVNESDYSFGLQYEDGSLQHVYPDELEDYLKNKKGGFE